MTETNKKQTPFGLWTSRITPELIGQASRLQDVQWVPGKDSLTWCQSLSGRSTIYLKPAGEAPFSLSGSQSPSGGIGYGGGEYCAGSDCIVFADRSGRLYRRRYGSDQPTPLTPAFGSCAAPAISPDGKHVAYVQSYEGKDVLALTDMEGQNWPTILASGADFYMQPAWSPRSDALVWVEWDHPNMPWDGTRLVFAMLDPFSKAVLEKHVLDGNLDMPIFQPVFSPDGQTLSYLRQPGDSDELVLLDLKSGEKRILIHHAIVLQPAWVQGSRVYAWTPDSRQIYYIENKLGAEFLRAVEVSSGQVSSIELEPYTTLSQPSISASGQLALIAESPFTPARVIMYQDGKVAVITRSSDESIAEGDLPKPQPIDWIASDGTRVFGIYYPPTNQHCTADGLPPAIIHIHGGPTSQVKINCSLDAAFFTSRGYAFLAVNYRGSTGYGRTYMQKLNQRWGEVDMIDAVEGAKALVGMGLADPDKLVIKGGSAGGYTVLNCLIHYPHFFKAGLCLYGVSNHFTMEMDTHKFEAHYNASLIGSLPEAAGKFHTFSPIFHADRIKDPIAVFQGTKDKVVPPDQSETIVAALRANKVPHEYTLYEGEGHGFKKTETLIKYYEQVDRFLKQYVIFSA